MSDDNAAAVRVLSVEVATTLVEADILRRELDDAKKREARLLHILDIARDEYEANNGRIVDGRDPHWTVMLRRAVSKRQRHLREERRT